MRLRWQDLEGATKILAAEPPAVQRLWVNMENETGFSMLMSVAGLARATPRESRVGLLQLLLKSGAEATKADDDGYTALHWAAAIGSMDVMAPLVEAGVDVNVLCKAGEAPLHRSARLGWADCVEEVVRLGADIKLRNQHYLTALDMAGHYEGKTNLKARAAVRKMILTLDPEQMTLILYHDDCLGHATPDYHQEAPGRLTAIMGKLHSARMFEKHELEISSDFSEASFELLAQAHTKEYLDFVQTLSDEVASNGEAVPFTPHVQRSISIFQKEQPKAGDMSDTHFTPGSLQAATRAAGSVVAAVDAVMDGKQRNAFCCVRPPGHHAGPSGLLDDAVSCGFCLFNNVAVGALHALRKRTDCRRVAIIDFDVHHGNGTQGVVDAVCDPSRGRGEDGSLADRLFFFSIHLFDSCRDCVEQPDLYAALERGHVPHSSAAARRRPEAADVEEWEFYPGTGAHDDVTKMVINAPLVPLWKKPNLPKIPSPKRTRKKSPKVAEAEAAAAEMEAEPGSARACKAGTPATTPVQSGPGAAGGPRGRAGFKDQIRYAPLIDAWEVWASLNEHTSCRSRIPREVESFD